MSKWIKFSRLYNHTPAKKSAVTLQFKADSVHQVTDEIAAAAIAGGVAVEVAAPTTAEDAKALRADPASAKPADTASTAAKSGKA